MEFRFARPVCCMRRSMGDRQHGRQGCGTGRCVRLHRRQGAQWDGLCHAWQHGRARHARRTRQHRGLQLYISAVHGLGQHTARAVRARSDSSAKRAAAAARSEGPASLPAVIMAAPARSTASLRALSRLLCRVWRCAVSLRLARCATPPPVQRVADLCALDLNLAATHATRYSIVVAPVSGLRRGRSRRVRSRVAGPWFGSAGLRAPLRFALSFV